MTLDPRRAPASSLESGDELAVRVERITKGYQRGAATPQGELRVFVRLRTGQWHRIGTLSASATALGTLLRALKRGCTELGVPLYLNEHGGPPRSLIPPRGD